MNGGREVQGRPYAHERDPALACPSSGVAGSDSCPPWRFPVPLELLLQGQVDRAVQGLGLGGTGPTGFPGPDSEGKVQPSFPARGKPKQGTTVETCPGILGRQSRTGSSGLGNRSRCHQGANWRTSHRQIGFSFPLGPRSLKMARIESSPFPADVRENVVLFTLFKPGPHFRVIPSTTPGLAPAPAQSCTSKGKLWGWKSGERQSSRTALLLLPRWVSADKAAAPPSAVRAQDARACGWPRCTCVSHTK